MRTLLCAFVLCATTAKVSAQDSIRKTEIPVVAKFADLSFTQQEIDSMFDGVKENVFEIRKMHKYPLSNSTPMSMWQSPVVAGMQFDTKQQQSIGRYLRMYRYLQIEMIWLFIQ